MQVHRTQFAVTVPANIISAFRAEARYKTETFAESYDDSLPVTAADEEQRQAWHVAFRVLLDQLDGEGDRVVNVPEAAALMLLEDEADGAGLVEDLGLGGETVEERQQARETLASWLGVMAALDRMVGTP